MEINKSPFGKCIRNHNLIFSEKRNKAIAEVIIDFSDRNEMENTRTNCDYIVNAINGFDALLEENKRLEQALQIVNDKYVNCLKLLSNATGGKYSQNHLSQETNAILNLSTVKEVGENGQ